MIKDVKIVSIPGFRRNMKRKSFFNFLLILTILVSNLKAFDENKVLPILGVASGAVFTWALIERFGKQKATNELKKVNQDKTLLETELKKWRDRYQQLKDDEQYIITVTQDLEKIDQYFNNEYKFWLENYNKHDSEYINNFLEVILNKVNLKSLTLDQFIVECKNFEKQFVSHERKLDLVLQDLSDRAKEYFVNQVKNLYINVLRKKEFISYCIRILDAYKYLFELKIFVKNNYEKAYVFEIEYVNQIKKNEMEILLKFDAYIRAKFNQYNFPYIAYIEKLNDDRKILSDLLNEIVSSDKNKVFDGILIKANELSHIFNNLIECIVQTAEYIHEKEQKPIFEREQQRLNLEIQEKEARIEQESKKVQTKLLEESNKKQELENQRKRFENERKELEVKEKQLMVEWARIRDGETIKNAIIQNDQKWSYSFAQLQSRYDTLKKEMDQLKKDDTKEISYLRKELSNVRLQLKNFQAMSESQSSEVNKLKNKINKAITSIKELQRNLNVPPVNPESVDGMESYLNKLKSSVSEVQNFLT